MSEIVIKVNNLSKVFKTYLKPRHRLQELIKPVFGKVHSFFNKEYAREFWALRDVSFEIKKGESVGIIGKNGAGKSTLLSLITGITYPTNGTVEVNGRVSALLELGSGFNPEFTGIENIYMNGSILGLTKEDVENKIDDILAFADIGDFVNQPVKQYSSGMMMRLAFAVQACIEPEILIVDEALGVGDIFFQLKCHAKMEKLQAKGTTILFVTHSMGSIEKYCSRAILLNHGKILFQGETSEAIGIYYNLENLELNKDQSLNTSISVEKNFAQTNVSLPSTWPSSSKFPNTKNMEIRIGNEKNAKLIKFGTFDKNLESKQNFHFQDVMYIYGQFKISNDIEVPVIGISILDHKNILIYGKNTIMHKIYNLEPAKSGGLISFEIKIPLNIPQGEFAVTCGLSTLEKKIQDNIQSLAFNDYANSMKTIVGYNVSTISVFDSNIGFPNFFGYCNLESEMSVKME